MDQKIISELSGDILEFSKEGEREAFHLSELIIFLIKIA
jgi:hypothetical protein